MRSACIVSSAILLWFAWLTPELSAEEVRLRLMAANLTSGNYQSYDPGEGLRIMDGLNPDIVMIQEFNYLSNTASNLRAMVDATFGTSYSYYRQNGGLQIPNGIISRYPIVAAGVWDDPQVSNRDFVWARIDIPGSIDLWAVSVHLLTASASVRNSEAVSLRSYIAANVPSDAYLAIAGDFNVDTRSEAALGTLSQVVVTAGPYPADRNGNVNTNAGRTKPYDGVYVDTELHGHATGVIVGSSVFPDGLIADTRVYSPISEISPALSTDSAVTGMQHMAVVRDFLIPIPEPTTGSVIVFSVMWFAFRRFRPGLN